MVASEILVLHLGAVVLAGFMSPGVYYSDALNGAAWFWSNFFLAYFYLGFFMSFFEGSFWLWGRRFNLPVDLC